MHSNKVLKMKNNKKTTNIIGVFWFILTLISLPDFIKRTVNAIGTWGFNEVRHFTLEPYVPSTVRYILPYFYLDSSQTLILRTSIIFYMIFTFFILLLLLKIKFSKILFSIVLVLLSITNLLSIYSLSSIIENNNYPDHFIDLHHNTQNINILIIIFSLISIFLLFKYGDKFKKALK